MTIEEQLVKVAHAVKHQGAGVLRFDGQVLGHHGRVPSLGKILRAHGAVQGGHGELSYRLKGRPQEALRVVHGRILSPRGYSDKMIQ